MSYLNKMGGTRSRSLCYIALKIWNLLIDNSISCSAFHIAGASNIEADFYSRFSNLHEFSLNSNAFLSLCKIIPFKLEIDLFASKENNKLENYVSLAIDDLFSFATDAFSLLWKSGSYIFPPIPLISKVSFQIDKRRGR